MRTLVIVVIATVLGLLSSACSTIVEGTDQSVTIITDPPGASCTVERAGVAIAVVDPTPGTINVDKSKDTLAVTCEKENHQTSAGVISSDFQSMTFGNILFGGIIGVAIDASSGAMNKYPDSVTILMVPVSFASAEERDMFFDSRIADVERNAVQTRESAEAGAFCKKDPEHPDCLQMLEEIDEARDAEIVRLNQQRASAVIE